MEFTGLRKPYGQVVYAGQLVWFSEWEDYGGEAGRTYFHQSLVVGAGVGGERLGFEVRMFLDLARAFHFEIGKWFQEYGVAQRGYFYEGNPWIDGWETDEDGWCGLTLFRYEPMYRFELSPFEVDEGDIYRRCVQDLVGG